MDNKKIFNKSKLALAIVLSVGLTACGGDDGSTATSNDVATATADATQPSEVNQVAKGSIQGVVLDTNGQPVVGATVSTAGKSMVTDSSGSYLFADLPVTNVAGSDGVTGHSPFVVVIQSPEGYAATVTVEVNPNAQIDAANSTTVNVGLTTFIDGFLAQADTAIVPKKESTVEGWLRIATGESVAGVSVSLDFTGLSTTLALPATTNFTVSGDTITTVTDAEGRFSFANVFNDSTFNLSATGYTFTAVGGTQTSTIFPATTAEGIINNVGTLGVKAITSSDAVKPFVATVTGYIGTDATFNAEKYAMLNRGVDDAFTVVFSEPLDAARFNADDVLVTLDNESYITPASVVLAADGRSVTVTLSAALDEGSKVSIFMPWADTTDTAGNYLDVAVNNASVLFDYLQTAGSGKASYLKVNLCVFIEPTAGGVGVATQVIDEVDGEDGDSSVLADYSNAYIDSREDSGDSVVQQVNGSDSAERLSMFRAIQNNATTTEAITAVAGAIVTLADTPIAILSYTVAGVETAITSVAANVLTVPALAGGEALVVNYVTSTYDDRTTRATIEFTGSAKATPSGYSAGVTAATPLNGGLFINSSDSSWSHYVDFDGVDHGDYGYIAYTDDLGVLTKEELIQFFDFAKPTTTIQDNYDLHGYNNTGAYTATVTDNGQAQYGNGGETSHALINDVPGNPTIYIQPRHLAQKGTGGAAPVRGTEFATLVSGMSARLGTGENPGAAAGNESTLTSFATNDPTLASALYDATAVSNWSVGQAIGVAFSETIALTTTGTPTFLGTQALTGYAAENSVELDVDGNTNIAVSNLGASGAIKPDLVIFNTSDVVSLANDDNGVVLGFATAVADTRGNVADVDSNAQVVLLDAMPAMVTSAMWTGTGLVVTFNEPITLSATTARNLQVWSPTDSTVTSGTVGVTTANGTLTNSGMTLTVALSSGQATAISPLFQNGNDNEFLYEDNAASTGEENHAVLAWDGMVDANGNAWSTFSDATAAFETRYEVRAPRFLMVNGVGTFTYSVATAGYLDTDATAGDENGAVTYTITFTHPIDLTSPADVTAALPTVIVASALGTAISVAEGGAGWSAPGNVAAGVVGVQTALSWNTIAASDTAIIEAVFSVNDIGAVSAAAGDLNAAGTFTTAAAVDTTAQASMTISADHRTITLNITAEAEGIRFGVTDFLFDTVVDSTLINGAQTSAGRFNWQNTN